MKNKAWLFLSLFSLSLLSCSPTVPSNSQTDHPSTTTSDTTPGTTTENTSGENTSDNTSGENTSEEKSEDTSIEETTVNSTVEEDSENTTNSDMESTKGFVESDPFTTDEFIEYLSSFDKNEIGEKLVYLKGKITSHSYDSTHQSYNLFLENSKGKTVEIYSAKLASGISDFEDDTMIGGEVLVEGYPKLYYNSKSKETIYELSYLSSTQSPTGKATNPKVISLTPPTTPSDDRPIATEAGYKKYTSQKDRLEAHPEANAFYGADCLDSIGEKNILVIPLYFSDAQAFTNAELDSIDKAYNGKAEETGWQSLNSYYKTSSYGKLDLKATIATPYAVKKTTKDFYNQYKDNLGDFLISCVQSYKDKFDFTKFDSDKNGIIDGVQFIYKYKLSSADRRDEDILDFFWNYTDTLTYSETYETQGKMKADIYFWSQMKLLKSGYYDIDIDTHTLIHETGHMLGLDDYYDYDQKTCPAGCVDMMDFNIGDHCATSKLLLGWVDPYVPDGTEERFEITLKDFESSGDCLMLVNPNTWNGSMYDEYFMVEYYTPTLLNEQDTTGYPEWVENGYSGNTYKKAGLKVFHTDHRLALFDEGYNNMKMVSFTDSFDKKNHDLVTVASSNTNNYSYSGFRKLEAVPATGKDYFIKPSSESIYAHMGDQKVLFSTSSYGGGSSSFTATTPKNILSKKTTLNDGSSIPYSFEVTAQSDSSITLVVSQLF